jgi:hypothetical protein
VPGSWGGVTEAVSTEKDRAGSSSASSSHDGKTESGDGELGGSSSPLVEDGGRASFLFLEEDVLTVSCPGSSGDDTYVESCSAGGGAGRKILSYSVVREGLMEQPGLAPQRSKNRQSKPGRRCLVGCPGSAGVAAVSWREGLG